MGYGYPPFGPHLIYSHLSAVALWELSNDSENPRHNHETPKLHALLRADHMLYDSSYAIGFGQRIKAVRRGCPTVDFGWFSARLRNGSVAVLGRT